MAKLARDEHHLILYADRAQQNHHTGVGIAGYRRGIEVIREAAGFNDNVNHTMLSYGNIEGPTRRSAPHKPHPKRHVIHLYIFSR